MHICFLHSIFFSTERVVELECVRHAEGRTNMPTSPSSICLFSLSLSLTYSTRSFLLTLTCFMLLQVVHIAVLSISAVLSRPGICCWTAVLLMPGSIAESLPRALASINTTAGNQRGQRERPHTKTCNAPTITSGQFVFSCIHTHFRAVCVGVCCQLLFWSADSQLSFNQDRQV